MISYQISYGENGTRKISVLNCNLPVLSNEHLKESGLNKITLKKQWNTYIIHGMNIVGRSNI